MPIGLTSLPGLPSPSIRSGGTDRPDPAVSASSEPQLPAPSRFPLWPAVLVASATSAGFAIFKLILICEIALDPAAAQRNPPLASLRILLDPAHGLPMQEALAQGLAAVLTVGILVGYLFNAPLAGAWRCGPLFVLSCLGMAVVAILAMPGLADPWLAALAMGAFYGTACAARGKVVPLLAQVGARASTRVNGAVNAGLVVGLLAGAVLGSVLADAFVGVPGSDQPNAGRWIDDDRIAHLVLAVLLALGVIAGLRLRVPEQAPTPFASGVRELWSGTAAMLRRHWAPLVSGGIGWGVCTAFSLAVLLHCIQTLHLPQIQATVLGAFAGLGAIVGNLVSHRFARRRWVVVGYLVLVAVVAAVPWLIRDFWSGAATMIVVGLVYMVPTNVVDARFLSLAHADGLAGLGGTVLSLVHNLFILGIGSGLALLLLGGVLTPAGQFRILAVGSVVAAAVAVCIRFPERVRIGP